MDPLCGLNFTDDESSHLKMPTVTQNKNVIYRRTGPGLISFESLIEER